MRFVNKVVIVTGAADGIGASTALLFAKEGAQLTLVEIDGQNLEDIAEKCGKTGQKPLVIQADLKKDEDTKSIVQKTIDKYKKLDILINCAGIIREDSVLDEDMIKKFDEVMNTNLRPSVYLMNLAAPYLIKTKGNIVSISSIAAFSASPEHLSYSVSKVGLDHFSRGVALQLGTHGVRVNTVSPGPTSTKILEKAGLGKSIDDYAAYTPLKKSSAPEEVCELILYLASDMARSVTGANYVIDNGCLVSH